MARIRDTGRLTDREIAQATGVSASTFAAWVRGSRSAGGVQAERRAELAAMIERLARVVEPSYISVWLQQLVPALEDARPIELLVRGKSLAVARLISGLESPGFSGR